jgi:hypothetical protein
MPVYDENDMFTNVGKIFFVIIVNTFLENDKFQKLHSIASVKKFVHKEGAVHC